MSAATATAAARRAAEALMVDTCRVRRRTGTTTNLTTGHTTPTYLDPDPYTGRCRVQQSPLGGAAQAKTVGEAAVLMVSRVLQLPVEASAGVLADDEVTITAVGSGSDPALLGKVFTVRSEFGKTHTSSRKLGIEEVTS